MINFSASEITSVILRSTASGRGTSYTVGFGRRVLVPNTSIVAPVASARYSLAGELVDAIDGATYDAFPRQLACDVLRAQSVNVASRNRSGR